MADNTYKVRRLNIKKYPYLVELSHGDKLYYKLREPKKPWNDPSTVYCNSVNFPYPKYAGYGHLLNKYSVTLMLGHKFNGKFYYQKPKNQINLFCLTENEFREEALKGEVKELKYRDINSYLVYDCSSTARSLWMR